MTYRVIAEVFAFLAEETEGDGIVAVSRGPMLFPLVTSNPGNLPRMREDAQAVADKVGCRVRLVRFTAREDVETIVPAGAPKQ